MLCNNGRRERETVVHGCYQMDYVRSAVNTSNRGGVLALRWMKDRYREISSYFSCATCYLDTNVTPAAVRD